MPRPKKRAGPKRSRLIFTLAVAVAALWLLPATWTARLGGCSQLALPLQDVAGAAADAAASALKSTPSHSPTEQAHGQRSKNEARLMHQIAALSARLAEVERENKILLATRVDGGIGSNGRLIRARVVARDWAPWRSSRTLSAGISRGVRAADAVVSREFEIDVGSEDGVSDGLAVLMGEVYLGFIAQVNNFSSRVTLVTDPAVQMKVRLGRFVGERFVETPKDYWLAGAGNGRMIIKGVARRDIADGTVAVGDTVLASPSQTSLPAAITIGTVEGISEDHNHALLSILTVTSAVNLESLRTVYIYDPAEPRP